MTDLLTQKKEENNSSDGKNIFLFSSQWKYVIALPRPRKNRSHVHASDFALLLDEMYIS